METAAVISKEMVERYLPNPIKRAGTEYRTWLEPSRSKSHIAINLEDGVYFDFHDNRGGNLVSLLKQFGAPISRELAGNNSWKSYQFQLSVLKGLRSEGRSVGCGRHTAIWRHKETGVAKMVAKVMCLRWSCPYCAPFLRRVWMEQLFETHFGAIYTVLKGYQSIGRLLDSVNRRAKRRGGSFTWLLLQANDVQILFVDFRSQPEVIKWLDDEPYFDRVATMPTWSERNQWLEEGLEKMDEVMLWKHKIRHSRGLFVCGDNDIASNTSKVGDELTMLNDKPDNKQVVSNKISENKYERVIVPYPIEEVVAKLELEGFTVQWCSEEGLVAFVSLPRGGPT